MPHNLTFVFPSTYSDSFLAVAVYLLGAAFVLLGCYVSVLPPKSSGWRIGSAVVFLTLAVMGFVVTKEQARRSAKAAEEAATASKVDSTNKMQYDKDVTSLRGELHGTHDAIEALARGSGNPKWGQLLSRLDSRHSEQVPACNATASRPYMCVDSLQLGTWIIEESTKLSDLATEAFHKIREAQSNTSIPKIEVEADNRATYFFLGSKVASCCLEQVRQMRREALCRLGPPSFEQPEMKNWESFQDLRIGREGAGSMTSGQILDYTPLLTKLGQELQRTDPPLAVKSCTPIPELK